jgi:hypothetical protein
MNSRQRKKLIKKAQIFRAIDCGPEGMATVIYKRMVDGSIFIVDEHYEPYPYKFNGPPFVMVKFPKLS